MHGGSRLIYIYITHGAGNIISKASALCRRMYTIINVVLVLRHRFSERTRSQPLAAVLASTQSLHSLPGAAHRAPRGACKEGPQSRGPLVLRRRGTVAKP